MINDFRYYLEKGHVKKRTPDPIEAESLLNKAVERLDYFRSDKIEDKKASIILENVYEAIRESAQSLMSLKGFKPYSQEVTISFIRGFYPKEFTEYEINKFDMFRLLRNDSVYRAVPISKEDAESCLKFAKEFVDKIKKLEKY